MCSNVVVVVVVAVAVEVVVVVVGITACRDLCVFDVLFNVHSNI